MTWESEQGPCLYVGDSQAGPVGAHVDPDDSVIEGTYQNYEVSSIFSSDFVFSRFEEYRCI